MKQPDARKPRADRGFALVVSLSLMVLLTLLAVGLLGLSAIQLRSTAHGQAMATARANARLAVLLALGDLQKHAGPDTRITATAGTLDTDSPRPMLTGVWNSRKLDPASPDTADRLTETAKSGDFRQWLVSHPSPAAAGEQDFGKTDAADGAVLLSRSVVVDPAKELRAARVPVSTSPGGKPDGQFAYAVLDEGVKARVNLGNTTPSEDLAARADALGGGGAPGLGHLEDLEAAGFDLGSEEDRSTVAKMVTLAQSELGHGVGRGNFGRQFHNLTAHSTGLMTRVTTGGLKEDLNLLAESATLPAAYSGKKLYQSAYGLNIASDPSWRQLVSHANLFQAKDARNRPYLTSTGGIPTLRATAPADWSAGTGLANGAATATRNAPSGPVLLPSIAKVQMVFSLLARDIYHYPKGGRPADTATSFSELHAPWGRNFAGSSYDYLLHMLYTPVITLHNPYNTAIEFVNLKIEFVNLPFSLQVFRNGVPQTNGMVPVTRMYAPSQSGGQTKRFGITLSNKSASGAPDGAPVRLLPGEVKVFSPYIPPTLTWASEAGTQAYFFDWRNENESDGRDSGNFVDTSQIKATPGWRGDGIGYDLDWFAPTGFLVSTVEKEGDREMERRGCIGLRSQDEIHVEFAPLPDPLVPDKRFTVEMTLQGANPNTRARTAVLEFNYETNDGLQKTLLGANGKLRYPENGTVNTMQLHDHSTLGLRDYVNPKPFALFSAYAKTTHGGFDPSSDDGSHPAKPWTFHNHTGAVSTQRIVSEHPAHHAHEINLVRLPGHTDEVIDIQPGTDRGNFVTGHTVFNGRRFGTLHDVPLGPIRSPVSLNFANPGAPVYPPRFTAPVGNSFAHPLMSSNAIVEPAPGSPLADHSYLLNSLLFDGYYCSGLQSRGGPFGDGRSRTEIAEDFLAGTRPPADSRFLPHLANRSSRGTALGRLTGDEGYRRAAAYQLLQGAFNVNSTSVEAWKAVLSAMSGSRAAICEIPATDSTATTESIRDLDRKDTAGGALFSRFRLPNRRPGQDGDPDAYWHAPRELDADEVGRLAEEIVAQVRQRGPFLSMGEFVNRRLGPPDESTLAGALQVAIDKAGLNDGADTGGYDIDPSKVATLKLRNPQALAGPSAQGAPGYLTQADILAMLGNTATVRSDTFTIRACGEATDANGKLEARAWCEAVVQRLPEHVDPRDEAETAPESLASPVNRLFGRRFVVLSFRWLGSGEI